MKIQLDTDNKTIKLDSNVKLEELIETLEKLLPKGLWKEFTLETNVIINNWSSPIVIERTPYKYYPWLGAVDCTNNTKMTATLSAGTYNIEC